MPVEQHDFTATEIRAGLLVLVSFVILVGFIAAVRGCRPHDDSAKQYYATFTDIGGLNRGADVRFGGVRVGRVTAIDPDAEDRSRIRVTVEVGGDIPVNDGSVASIEQVTMTAEKHLEITTGGADQPLHESGDTLSSSPSHGLLDLPDLEGVVVRLDTLLDGLNILIGVNQTGDAAADVIDLKEIFVSLKATLDESAQVARDVSAVIGENRAGLGEIVKRLSALEEAATELMTQLNAVVAENRGLKDGSRDLPAVIYRHDSDVRQVQLRGTGPPGPLAEEGFQVHARCDLEVSLQIAPSVTLTGSVPCCVFQPCPEGFIVDQVSQHMEDHGRLAVANRLVAL